MTLFPEARILAWIALIIGTLFIFAGITHWLSPRVRKWVLWPSWSIILDFGNILPFYLLMSLKEASLVAYEELKGTQYGRLLSGLNNGMVLDTFASAIAMEGKVYGKEPPSRKIEEIPEEEKSRCDFVDDGNAMKRHGEEKRKYIDLLIDRKNLRKFIDDKRKETIFPSQS